MSCAAARVNAARVRRAASATLLALAAAAPALLLGIQRRRSLTCLLALAAAVSAQTWRVAAWIERSLTSGIYDYPPPRNRPDTKGSSRELRTVEQGRTL